MTEENQCWASCVQEHSTIKLLFPILLLDFALTPISNLGCQRMDFISEISLIRFAKLQWTAFSIGLKIAVVSGTSQLPSQIKRLKV